MLRYLIEFFSIFLVSARELKASARVLTLAKHRRSDMWISICAMTLATAISCCVAAMLMQQGITDPAAVEAALEHFATDLGSPGRDVLFGFGLIEARSGLRGLGLAR